MLTRFVALLISYHLRIDKILWGAFGRAMVQQTKAQKRKMRKRKRKKAPRARQTLRRILVHHLMELQEEKWKRRRKMKTKMKTKNPRKKKPITALMVGVILTRR